MKLKTNKSMKAKGLSGSGWHNDSIPHSNARKFGSAGRNHPQTGSYTPEDSKFWETVEKDTAKVRADFMPRFKPYKKPKKDKSIKFEDYGISRAD